MPKIQKTETKNLSDESLSNVTPGTRRLELDPKSIVSAYCNLFGAHSALSTLFRKNIQYFEDSDSARIAVNRIKQVPTLIRSSGLVELTSNSEGSPLLLDAIFLIAARGNLKEIVHQKGSVVRSELQSRGYNTDKLINLSEPSVVRSVLERVMAERVIKNPQSLSNQLLFSTGRTLGEFHENPDLFSVFSDDVASALRDSLQKRALELGTSHSKYNFVREALESIAPVMSGGLTVELVTRDKSCLTQGALSGDCTAPGSFNNWTVGPWALTYENQLFRFDYQGTFFARTVMTAGYHLQNQERAVPSQWHHAIEFSPLARVHNSGSKLADPVLQQELFRDLISFTASFAQTAGCSSSFLTTVSNSIGFGRILTSLVQGENSLMSSRPSTESFILPSPLRTAHEIRSMLHREFASDDRPISTYLQGAQGRTRFKLSTPMFPRINTEESRKTREREEGPVAVPTIPGITRERLDVVSRLFMDRGEEIIHQRLQELELLGAPSYRAALKEAIFSRDPHTSLGKSFRKIQAATIPLIEQIDPGVVDDVGAKFSKALKAAVRNCEEIRFRASIVTMDHTREEVRKIEDLAVTIVQNLNSALKRNEISTPTDVRKIISALLPARDADVLYDDEFESDVPQLLDDEYSDLLDSLAVELPPEEDQVPNPLLECVTLSLDSAGALEALLNGLALTNSVAKKFRRELIYSYYVSQTNKIDLRYRDAAEEIENILSHKSENQDANFLGYRPSEWAQLHKNLTHFLKNASYSRGINVESYVALVARLSPTFLEDFARSLVEPGNVLLGLSEVEADIVMQSLPTLVEYYKHASERRTSRRAPSEPSLLCRVNLFKIHLPSSSGEAK
jgi:hypothetical protein